jgi:hypothetical protein
MKVWIAFLVAMFLLGGWEFRRGRPVKTIVVLGVCTAVALALQSYGYV